MAVKDEIKRNLLFTIVYGSTKEHLRNHLYSAIQDLRWVLCIMWILSSNFNDFADVFKINSTKSYNALKCRKFKEWMKDLGLINMGFQGRGLITRWRGRLVESIESWSRE